MYPTHRAALCLGLLWCGYYYTNVIVTSSPTKNHDPDMPSLQTLSKVISSVKPANEFPCLHAMTDCPAPNFFTAACSTQITVQATIAICYGMGILIPYGQAYCTKSSFLRIVDPTFPWKFTVHKSPISHESRSVPW